MPQQGNKILSKMLERLFSALISGPSMNCKPHTSRQRVDLAQFAKLKDIAPEQLLRDLLSEQRTAKVVARVLAPRKKQAIDPLVPTSDKEAEASPEEKAAQQVWSEQQSTINKVKSIVEDAKTYENDTGVHVLHIGFPLLNIPPGSFGGPRSLTRRILAPLAFISVSVTLKGGSTTSIELGCASEGVDLVIANAALMSWLEQQTGKKISDLFEDDAGEKPWEEICGIVQKIAGVLELQTLPMFANEAALVEGLQLRAAPRADGDDEQPSIIPAAVLGLYPAANQGLLRDMQALVAGEELTGPIQSFTLLDSSLHAVSDARHEAPEQIPAQHRSRKFADERLISRADPCQARAVKLARAAKGLVVHGPPGTGKSQTISNVIGDRLARGERVLFVCDKRTALDVVINRLDSLGLRHLCAIVHDAQRDQRDLYKTIRDQLDNLADARSDSSADGKLASIDAELQRLHAELTAYQCALAHLDGDGSSFHQLVGQWLHLSSYKANITESALVGIDPKALEEQVRAITEILQRGQTVHYPKNPWVQCAGLPLAEFLSLPMDQIRLALADCARLAKEVDATADPTIPPLGKQGDAVAQGQARAKLADQLDAVIKRVSKEALARWAKADARLVRQSKQRLADAKPFTDILHVGPLDGELGLIVKTELPAIPAIGQQIGALERYSEITTKWYAMFCFGTRSRAGKVADRYNMPLDGDTAKRLAGFLSGLRARLIIQSIHCDLCGQCGSQTLLADDVLEESIGEHTLLFDVLTQTSTVPELDGLSDLVGVVVSAPAESATIIQGLRRSLPWGQALVKLDGEIEKSKLFTSRAIESFKNHSRKKDPVASAVQSLYDRLDTLESILRIRDGLASLPVSLRTVMGELLQQGVPADAGLTIIRKAVLAQEIIRRLKSDPQLQGMDDQRLKTSFERYRALDQQKKELVRLAVQHRWLAKQKQRLLATTGSRLNSDGADLRRRLTIRGQRAMRLRQVIAIGQGIEDGDPLFDLRPVWMASPETVAQIFSRKPQFDVVIFDEASQCRLEDALPVMLRGHRVVIAGDPKQLPPTRFFESALVTSEDEEAETDQDLFEAQQGEIEDLLAAALNIEIDECYLDVHYRSRNADLIEFSNQQFYGSRLQPIPGHPANRTRYAPLTLYKTNGVYDKRSNPAEVEQVCRIVQDLLKRATPPSIGIASFNIQQRDLILDRLEQLAAEDAEFSRRLAEARVRRSESSFEGLFVKNLENVQGDERDHIIISTTFGPDPKGRFYRRFGPLGRAGGGRRLNVLVTRAREEVHLVTSIPESIYRALPPIPAGETPGGAWLLFSYLAYAETLAEQYEQNHRILTELKPDQEAVVNVRPTQTPSAFAEAFADKLAKRNRVGSDVNWGNDGFCVDVALHHPHRAEDVTIGVLCDMSRYARAEDPVEWEVFRTAILESQGWELHRLWTPHFFRDRQGCTTAVLNDVARNLAAEEEKDAIKVIDDRKSPS